VFQFTIRLFGFNLFAHTLSFLQIIGFNRLDILPMGLAHAVRTNRQAARFAQNPFFKQVFCAFLDSFKAMAANKTFFIYFICGHFVPSFAVFFQKHS
jgi:hypothetical protein